MILICYKGVLANANQIVALVSSGDLNNVPNLSTVSIHEYVHGIDTFLGSPITTAIKGCN